MNKKIKIKVVLAIVLSIILLFLIVCFQSIKVKMIERDIANRYYNDYYLKLVPHKSEDELRAHFDKMGGRISVSTESLANLNVSFAENIKDIGYEDRVLIIKPQKPYINGKYTYEFYKQY